MAKTRRKTKTQQQKKSDDENNQNATKEATRKSPRRATRNKRIASNFTNDEDYQLRRSIEAGMQAVKRARLSWPFSVMTYHILSLQFVGVAIASVTGSYRWSPARQWLVKKS